jgi:hypothetical protein
MSYRINADFYLNDFLATGDEGSLELAFIYATWWQRGLRGRGDE